MSNKLSRDKQLKSRGAVSKYVKDNGNSNSRRVVVIKNGQTIVDDKFNVTAAEYNIYMKVDIFWEDSICDDFRKWGLYGSYSTTYCPMSYNNKQLKINPDANTQIIIG